MRGESRWSAIFFVAATFFAVDPSLPTLSSATEVETLATPQPELRSDPSGTELGRWRVVESDFVRLTVDAPGAERVRLFYKPFEVIGRRLDLGTIEMKKGESRVTSDLHAGPDLAGDFWAHVEYPGGVSVDTERLPIAHATAMSDEAEAIPLDWVGGSVTANESARSDALTGGTIERSELVPGDPRIWITVDVPAFRLTLWQAGKEVAVYPIGIGRKAFPLPIGPRKATEIVWNPEWIPPDSSWVEASEKIEAGERIDADDPRNPLGKMKIRLGDAVLIHEAARSSDIGGLVSHGCVRMMRQELFDLAEKIVAARGLPMTQEEIAAAEKGRKRLSAKLEPPLWVDVDYDTEVIEGGRLHVYPDVYGRGVEIETMRADLRENGALDWTIDEVTFALLRKRVSQTAAYVIPLGDLAKGEGLAGGEMEPIAACALAPPESSFAEVFSDAAATATAIAVPALEPVLDAGGRLRSAGGG